MDGWLAYIASAAFLAGIAGGVHCAGMCGPIIAACSGARGTKDPTWQRAAAYNAGRIASYALAGSLAGALGAAAIGWRGNASLTSVLALFAGASMLLLALHLAGVPVVTRALEAAGARVWVRLQPLSRGLLPADTWPRTLALGALWGWLPCGMVYGTLVVAAASASAAEGAWVMLAFGLGTLPNVLAMALAARRLRALLARRPVRLGCAALVALGGSLGIAIAAVPESHPLGALLCRLGPAGGTPWP